MKNIYSNILMLNLLCVTVFAQNIDCNGILDGSAVLDDCGTCQMAYIYNPITHDVSFLSATNNVNVISPDMLVHPQDMGNPYWNDCGNNYPVDCNNFVYGPALVDDCDICRLSYIYNVVTHDITMINHESDYILTENEMLVAPNTDSSPYWNDCLTDINENTYLEKNLIQIVDVFGRELKSVNYNQILFFIYSDESVEKKFILN